MAEDFSDSGMIALVPSKQYAEHLAIEGGEHPDKLHVTLTFLGDVSGIGDADEAIRAVCRNIAREYREPLYLKAFATAHFNPDGESPCAVYLIGDDSGALDELAEKVQVAVEAVFPGLPKQHRPFVPHLTITYGGDPNALTKAGPVIFDRIRYAHGYKDEDFMLNGMEAPTATQSENEGSSPWGDAGHELGGGDMAHDYAEFFASAATDVISRLERAEAVIVARAVRRAVGALDGWDEALHPRGSDGQFIDKNGGVKGIFTLPGGSRIKSSSGKVLGFKSGDGASSDDPWVLSEITQKDGKKVRGVARASELTDKGAAKARLDQKADTPDEAKIVQALRDRAHKSLGQSTDPYDDPNYDDGDGREIPERAAKADTPDEAKIVQSLRDRAHKSMGQSTDPYDDPKYKDGDLGDIRGVTLTPDFIARVQSNTDEPIVVNSVEEAVQHLAEGHKIELSQPEQVSTLLDKLAVNVREAKAAGIEAPNYDLCNVTAKGTNLFCVESKGIPRIVMPQLSGPPRPGSRAAQMTVNRQGNVDLSEQFRAHLAEKGVPIKRDKKPASHLRASQNELNGGLVGSLAKAMEEGTFDKESPIFISKDNYVVDGHHRWAATVGEEFRTGEDIDMDVDVIDMGIIELLAAANNFSREWGIGKAAKSGETPSGPERRILPPLPTGLDVQRPNAKTTDYQPPDPRVNDPEFVEAQNRVAFGQALGMAAGFDTQTLEDKVEGIINAYNEARQLQQEEIIQQFLEKSTAKKEKKLVFMGGLPGAGKTTLINSEVGQREVGIDLAEYITVNPDEVKEAMAVRGMVPDYKSSIGLEDHETAGMVHEESSYIAELIANRARAQGYNVVLDITLKSADQYRKKSDPFSSEGYTRQLVFVDVPPYVAMQRAIVRSRGGPDGQGEKRYITLDLIAQQAISDAPDQSLNQRAFEEVADTQQADRFIHFENTNGARLIRRGGRQV